MIKVVQITLNEIERLLLNRIIRLGITFTSALWGNNTQEDVRIDAPIMKYVMEHPNEVEALLKKLNLDRL